MSYLLKLVLKLLTVNRKTLITTIKDLILRYTEVLVNSRQLYKLKSLLTEDTRTQQIDDFPKLPIYLERLYKANLHDFEDIDQDGLVTELVKTENATFRRIYIGPHTANQQYAHSLPFVALDGTYLRNCFKQTLLLAVGRNGNNEGYIIAWAIVESENENSWDWFLKLLLKTVPLLAEDYPLGHIPCVISDRNAGLLKAIRTHLPNATDVYCCWHLLRNILNLTKHVNKNEIRKAWWAFPYAKNEADWNRAIQQIQIVGGEEVVSYIESLDKSKFCEWKVPGPRYGHNSSGVVKS